MKLIILSAVCSVLVSCATLTENLSKYSYIISPLAQAVTTVIFDAVVDDQDQVEKATILKKLADKIKDFKVDHKPTRDEIYDLVAKNLPEKSHWAVVAKTVADTYEKYTKNLSDENVTKSLEVLKAIGNGISKAAESVDKGEPVIAE